MPINMDELESQLEMQKLENDRAKHYLSNINEFTIGDPSKKESKRIQIFKSEDLSLKYNLNMTNRIRPEPKLIHKYSNLANIFCVVGYKNYKHNNFVRGSASSVAKTLNRITKIPISSLKVKISQLRDYDETGNIENASYEMMNTFDEYKNVSSFEMYRLARNSYLYSDKELLAKFKELIK